MRGDDAVREVAFEPTFDPKRLTEGSGGGQGRRIRFLANDSSFYSSPEQKKITFC